MLQAGDPAPDFTMEADKGGRVSLKELRGKTVVLYFYPKDDTPGCTRESCAFRDHYPSFQGRDVLIYGVSCDDIPSHEKFAAKYDLPFPLLSDPDTSVSTAYGVYKEKTNYGRKYMGIERSTFVIDGDGRISRIFRNVKVDGHVEKVLDEVSG
ncbi:MAG: thioredoxin-dependent thiol peroxidase [Gemmatimonadetes bacterium]|nr:thioredoxin-dependent thiol peroxidase [Gemmatimonadota bacterium]MYH19374.1 thioredoxin-dependent thiol peroxidase [Gemmatimonadota bacterium]MYK97447.1 thioredoxin-dependent thiol peroxidase [Gemmatimonadota bacterium]